MHKPPSTSDALYEKLLAGQPADSATPETRIHASASIVLWRRRDDLLEVYWVRRSPRLRFMGGWWAFPGGRLDPADRALGIAGTPSGPSTSSCHLSPHERKALREAEEQQEAGGSDNTELIDDLAPGIVAAALRELFEETGLLVTSCCATSTARPGQDDRAQLLAGERTFADILAGIGPCDEAGAGVANRASTRDRAVLDASSLSFAGRWLTPPFAPIRFDNRFFLLPWDAEYDDQPTILEGELVAGEWIQPVDALARWRSGETLVAPPILHILRVLAEDGPDRGLGRLRQPTECRMGPFQRIEMLPGVVLLPLRTPTLPPATHTNAFLLGMRQAVLVDPGPWPGPEQDRLIEALHAAQRDHGLILAAIWLTHHHRDHVGAAMRVRATFDTPIAAHQASRPGLQAQGIEVDSLLADGQRLTLAGQPSLELEVVHTPGHARGHVSIWIAPLGALVSGDLVSALSTMVIDPPEGDMDAYLDSLARVEQRNPRILLPAHGPLISRAVERLRWFRQHRLERERAVLEAWQRADSADARRAASLVSAVYGALDPRLVPIAARQVEAHLERLRRLNQLSLAGA